VFCTNYCLLFQVSTPHHVEYKLFRVDSVPPYQVSHCTINWPLWDVLYSVSAGWGLYIACTWFWRGGGRSVHSFIQSSLRIAPCLLTAWGKRVYNVCNWFALLVSKFRTSEHLPTRSHAPVWQPQQCQCLSRTSFGYWVEVCSIGVVTLFLTLTEYNRSNSTKSPASGTSNVSERTLTLEVGRVLAALSFCS
jgi:hypothetical protein